MFLAPVLWNAAANAHFRSVGRCLFFVFTFGLYAAQFCPTWYALKQAGPDRLLDIIFYSAFFWMAVNLFYFLGWLQRRLWAENGAVPQGRYTIGFVAVTAALLAVSCFAMRDMLNFTSIQALNALRTGQAQQYHSEFCARVEVLEDTTVARRRFAALFRATRVLCILTMPPVCGQLAQRGHGGIITANVR